MQQETTLTKVASHAPSVAEPAAEHAEHHVDHLKMASFTYNIENSKMAMWLFLASEMFLFSVLIIAYIIARYAHPEEHAQLNVPLTSINTFILLLSSFSVVWALSGVQMGNQTRLLRGLAGVIVLGSIFFLLMMYEYSELSHHGITLAHPFGMAFYALTGLHGAHVLIGLVWAIYVFNRAFNGVYTKESYWGVEFWGLYWHFVDVVWIFIFTVVYLL
ncbi:MAG: cytochrome oxidase subunit III [Candidatus Thermofonsia Clade 1 bacterium]|jgi:heme/copper-type cytochrome/quinol oxidase subunit 3|uniref:Cytochrome oxidase subunit III n=1 Tax=Candidatus Thermofonsia Clade 1 bacterium TaxID=2364210 RepID=A0A2M8Q040_9CHLR|nr:MAG: cytochrome oxidase subunit III [Candidatus Thermofonsia Clade 1 bacterium]PJF43171.1 MAG: cytochrome oxidase subunit III [Candidatus Thermofonsia Clade 1 bacterium]RMF52327.1 MAG: heme-copper oxidase subunit III [Chloroflexota bacterium]